MGLPNIGPLELIIILAIALLIVGPGRLPEMGNAIGRTIKEFRKASTDMTEAATIETEPKPATPATPVAPAATAAPVADASAAATAAEAAAPAVEVAPASPQPNTLSSAATPNTTAQTPLPATPSEPKANGSDNA